MRSKSTQKSEVVESRRNSEFDQKVAPDLSGTPRFTFYDTKAKGRLPNILIVMLEGISGGHIPSLASTYRVKIKESMPKMSALAKKNFGSASFISHQRQTDRGEYSILCGDVPKLTRKPPRMTDIATSKAPRECLPEFLNRHGYETVYLQPAPMSFMMKDRFMDKIGFKISKGADFF
jgi:phosphoglycerol transferase MdoB-like AlkP superfamily enzyme